MALVATKGPIPKNAIALTPAQAVSYQWEQVQSWPDRLDVWPFSWGIVGLGSIAAIAGLQINALYRKKLHLRHYGLMTSTLPMFAPAMFSAVLHTQVVTNDLFLQKKSCSLCLQYKAALIQISVSTIYPLVLSPIANFVLAQSNATYRLPYYKDIRGHLSVWWKFTKPMGFGLIVNVFIQAVAASCITYFEAKSLNTIYNKIKALEKERAIEDAKPFRNDI